MWTAAHDQILTLDNLMLRGHTLANRCCMYCCNEESVDHLLISCPVTHSLWMYMLRLFGIDWVMPSSVADLFFCWYHWLGKHNFDISNLVLGCLMWTILYIPLNISVVINHLCDLFLRIQSEKFIYLN